jgi:hypothetical protein
MRHLRADWRRWSRTERFFASLLAAGITLAIPILPLLAASD